MQNSHGETFTKGQYVKRRDGQRFDAEGYRTAKPKYVQIETLLSYCSQPYAVLSIPSKVSGTSFSLGNVRTYMDLDELMGVDEKFVLMINKLSSY